MLRLETRLAVAMAHCTEIRLTAEEATQVAGFIVTLRRIANREKLSRIQADEARRALSYAGIEWKT